MLRITGPICFLFVACGMSNAQAASGMPPLVEIKSLDNNTYIFDVSKISAVTIQPHYIGGDPGPPMQLPHPGPMATHIWGAVKLPIPVDGSTQDFLTKYKLDKKFITVHGTPTEVHLKATAISLIEPHLPTYQEEQTCKGKPDNSSCSFSSAGGVVTNGTCHKIPISNVVGCMSTALNSDLTVGDIVWPVSDDPEAIKQLIDTIRGQPD